MIILAEARDLRRFGCARQFPDAREQLTDVVLDFLSRFDDPHRVAASRFVRALERSPMGLRLHLVLR